MKDAVPVSASPAMVAIVLGFVALASRLPYIMTPALWIDEAFSAFYAAKGLTALWGRGWLVDPTPPVYYCLLALWEHVFGLSEVAMRSLSLALTCVTAGLICGLGHAFGSRVGGLLAALIWLLMPLNMDYSLEIRAYALQLAVLSGLLLSAVTMLKRYERDPQDMQALTRSGLLVTILSLLAFYTHVTSLFAVLGISAAILWQVVRKADARALRRWFAFSLLFLLGAAPQVWASYFVVTANHETLTWLPAGSVSWTIWTLRSLFLGEIVVGSLGKGVVLTAWFMALAHGVWRLRRDRTAMDILVLAPAVGFSSLVAFSLFVPILLPRTAMWTCIPLALIAGLGLARCPARVAIPALVLAGTMLLTLVVSNMRLRESWRSDYRGAALIAQRDPDALVVTVDGERACIMDFYGYFKGRIRLLDLEADQLFNRTQNVDLGCNTPPAARIDDLRRHFHEGRALWVIGSTDPTEDRSREVALLTQRLAGVARVTERIDTAGYSAGRFEAIR